MNEVQQFKNRVLRRRDLLFKHFGLIRKYPVHRKISLEPWQTSKVDGTPHNYAISSKIDLSSDYMFLYAVELEEFGILPDGEDVSDEILIPETDEFSLQLTLSHLFRHNRVVTLQGMLRGGTSVELIHLESGAICSVWGLSHKDIPNEFYKETIAEALCFELDGRLKQAFFLYMTAIDSFISSSLGDLSKFQELSEHITYMKIEDKLSLCLRRCIDRTNIDDIPLVSYLKSSFFKCLKHRNTIAHSARSIDVGEEITNDAVFLILVLQMIRGKQTADLKDLKKHFDLGKKISEDKIMPRS